MLHKSFMTVVAALTLLVSAPAFADHDHAAKGDIHIAGAWAKASIGQVPNGAAFMTIENAGAADRVVAATSDIADRTELHTHLMENNVMKMRQVDGIDVPMHGSVMLEPGSYHVMLLGLHAPLVEGDEVSITLEFEKAGTMTVPVKVVSPKESAPMGGMDHKGAHSSH